MKKEQFLDIMDDISDDLIEDLLDIPCKAHCSHKKTHIRKALILTAVVSMLIGGTAYAGITTTSRYSIQGDAMGIDLFIEQHPSDKDVLEKYYYIPEKSGWSLVDVPLLFDILRVSRYERDGYRVSLSQCTMKEAYKVDARAEPANIEMLSLWEENDAITYEVYSTELIFGRRRYLLWARDGYLFELTGTISKEDAVKLAYSATTELP